MNHLDVVKMQSGCMTCDAQEEAAAEKIERGHSILQKKKMFMFSLCVFLFCMGTRLLVDFSPRGFSSHFDNAAAVLHGFLLLCHASRSTQQCARFPLADCQLNLESRPYPGRLRQLPPDSLWLTPHLTSPDSRWHQRPSVSLLLTTHLQILDPCHLYRVGSHNASQDLFQVGSANCHLFRAGLHHAKRDLIQVGIIICHVFHFVLHDTSKNFDTSLLSRPSTSSGCVSVRNQPWCVSDGHGVSAIVAHEAA